MAGSRRHPIERARQDEAASLDNKRLVLPAGQLRFREEDGELYVDETLRIFWPRLPAAARRRSMLRILRGLVDAGLREGAIHPATDADLAVALLVGTMGQVARMAYFDEIERPISSRTEGLRALFLNALTGEVPR